MIKVGVYILRLLTVTALGLAFFYSSRPLAGVCAISIRRRWPDAWFSGLIVWDADFLALSVSIIIAVLAVSYLSNRDLSSH